MDWWAEDPSESWGHSIVRGALEFSGPGLQSERFVGKHGNCAQTVESYFNNWNCESLLQASFKTDRLAGIIRGLCQHRIEMVRARQEALRPTRGSAGGKRDATR